jgi:outer membrane protein assembly factor BamB/putative flippase GtrA
MSKSSFLFQLGHDRKRQREVVFFALIGLLNTAIDFAVLNALTLLTNHHSGPSLFLFNCLSFSVAVVNSYVLNGRLTFQDTRLDSPSKFLRFVGVNLIGAVINSGIVWLLAPHVGRVLSPIAAVNVSKAVATLVSLSWNYLVVSRWVFVAKTPTSAPDQRSRSQKESSRSNMKQPKTRLIKFLAALALVVVLLLTAIVRSVLQAPPVKGVVLTRPVTVRSGANQAVLKPKVWATGSDWPMYLNDIQRTSASSENDLSPSNVGQITQIWSFKTGDIIAASATVVDGTVYFGSWDGYEYALDAMTGAFKWKTYLGKTVGRSDCNPPKAGVTSSAAVQGGVVYVGGGDAYWYALDAKTGAVLWKVYTGETGAIGGHYNWSSPLIYQGFAYIGIASFGDCPLVPGKLLKVSLSTHKVVNTFNAVEPGEIGGGIWTSPSIDTATNTIYIAAATETMASEVNAQSSYSLDATTLALKSLWKPPESDFIQDSDFDTSPILFKDAAGRPLVASVNKNGKVYVLDRDNLSAGPVWEKQIVNGGDCPLCENSSVSSGAFGQGTLYLAGANSTINGVDYRGSVHALDPATGKFLWQRGEAGPVFGALAYTNGLLIVGDGGVLEVLDATTGNVLYSYDTGGQRIYTAPSISHGIIYVGSSDGYEHAFGIPSTVAPPVFADSHCPSGWLCQDIGNPLFTGSETSSGGRETITASGAGIGGVSDGFRLLSQNVGGDAQISAEVASWQQKNGLSQAGLMVRQSNDPTSPYYSVLLTPGSGLVVDYRTGFGMVTIKDMQMPLASAPLYLEIQRLGDQFQAATSTNGSSYTQVSGSTVTLAMPTTVMAGPAVSAGSDGLTSAAVFAEVSVSLITSTLNPPPPLAPCPAGWGCQDLGNPAILGKQVLNDGTWTLQGAGEDLWGTQDQGHFVWQTLSGDGSITARVSSPAFTDPWAKAGIMLRENTDAGSVYYGIIVMPSASGNGIEVQSRSKQDLLTVGNGFVPGQGPIYLKIERIGDNFTAYTSANGVAWKTIPGSTVALNMSNTVLAGLLVTSHKETNLTTATFDRISIG